MGVRALLGLSVLLMGLGLGSLGWRGLVPAPEGPEAQLLRGIRLLEEEAWQDAAGVLRRALASPQDDVRRVAHYNLALALLELALEENGPRGRAWALESVSQAEEALRLDPDFHGAAWNLELALRRAEALAEGEEADQEDDARRLLTAFRLGEEGRLSGHLRGNFQELNAGGPFRIQGGPWW